LNRSLDTNIQPRIKTVRFPKGKIVINLLDGRTLIMPSEKFPEIERLTISQKRKYKTLAGIGLMFEDLDTVYHISDFIGKGNPSDIPIVSGKSSKIHKSDNIPVSRAAESIVKYGKG
jgi:hypothetical protein